MKEYISKSGHVKLVQGDFLLRFQEWETPVVIISDGPYGIGGYDGDPMTAENLGKVYEPFIRSWSEVSTPLTTLWFWNTELGWANVHPVLEKYGWEFINCHIWDKGLGHVAGNANSKTLRKLPVVTEVCVQYIKKAFFNCDGRQLTMQDWLRYEWLRTGLPLSKTNEACDVKNAATRKYFTNCHLWYFPPAEAFAKFSEYANLYGKDSGKPFFSIDGKKPITKDEWEKMRAKFYCPFGVTNVWREPPLNGNERIKIGSKALHLNQKPLKFMRLMIEVSSDKGDVIWEPFGGLCSAAIASHNLGRKCYSAEIAPDIFEQSVLRLKAIESQLTLNLL